MELVLAATLDPDAAVRRQGERQLDLEQAGPQFPATILALVQHQPSPGPLRLAAAIAFKNYIQLNWARDDAVHPLSTDMANQIKDGVVAVMLSLSSSPNLQIQLAQAITTIAHQDFPHDWPQLIPQLVAALTPTNFQVNNAVLTTAHSIFNHWRSEFRTDELFLQIKFVLEQFSTPFLDLFVQTDALLSNPAALTPATHAQLLKTLHLLLLLYHDLNAQDLPEFFEDRLPQFMSLLLTYLSYVPPSHLVPLDTEEEDVTDLEHVKSEICEIASLYSVRYLDAFGEGGFLGPFVEKTWTLLIGVGKGMRYDALVAKALAFLGVVVKMASQKSLFEAKATLESFCERIILPNMGLREFEEEMFEDDAPEYVRRDLEGANSETRRQAASDFTRALMQQFEAQVTEIVSVYIGGYLAEYAASPATAWKSKDTAIFLLTSIATRGSTVQQGVTSTNALVDVVKFFSDHILRDLEGTGGQVHPVIVADAIKYLYTFRTQLTKEQLLAVLPLLVPHLQASSYVIHTYAAITIERILFIKVNSLFLLSQSDLRPYSESILSTLLKKIKTGATPEKVAENEALMKAVMRVIITSRQALTPYYGTVLGELVSILGEISKNPSNPKFNLYTFESISALVRFITAGSPATLPAFEAALFPPFLTILSTDIPDFTPFVFQILSQLLELHPAGTFPSAYKALLPPLLTPTLWEQKGNVPALVRLLRAFLARGAEEIVRDGQVGALLGVFQHLISSRANDLFGFELLEALFEFLPREIMTPYMSNPIFVLLLTRLQSSKTDKFCGGLIRFICFCVGIQKEGVTVDGVIGMLDRCQPQPGLFAQVLPVLLPDVQKAPTKDRKILAVGLAKILTHSELMLTLPFLSAWTPIMQSLLKLFLLPLSLVKQHSTTQEEEIEIQDEEITYQVGFAKLGAAVSRPLDPVGWVEDPREFLARSLVECARRNPGKIMPLVQAAGAEFAGPFLTYLDSNGFQLA